MADYAFHLTFADGSNPYLSFPAAEKAHKAALNKWRRNYTLTLNKRTESPTGTITEWFTATAKRPPIDLFDQRGLED